MMEDEEKHKFSEHLQSTEGNVTAVGGMIENEILRIEKAQNSNEKSAEDDLHIKTQSENGLNTFVAEEVQMVPGEATPDPSHAAENHTLKTTPARANGEYGGDNEDDKKRHDVSAMPSDFQEEHNSQNPDSKDDHLPMEYRADVLGMGYNSFVQEVMGCINELRKAEDDLDEEKAAQPSVNSNEDNERETRVLSDSTSSVSGESGANVWTEYFEHTLFETIPNYVNDECIARLDVLNDEPCLEGGVHRDPTLNASNADMDFGTLDSKFTRSISPSQGSSLYDSDMKLPIPENFQDHRWCAMNGCAYKLGSSGFCYMGDIADGRMHGFGRLMLGNRGHFMEGIWKMNQLLELFSCQLTCYPGNQTVLIIKRQNDHLLTMYENHYVARVTVNAIEELDFTRSIEDVKYVFFRKLIVLEEVADELEHKRQVLLNKFAALLSKAIGVNASPLARANTFFLLSLYLGRSDADLSDIVRNRNIPVDVREAASDLLDCENNYLNNNYIFSNKATKLRLDLKKVLERVYNEGIALYRQMLIDKCPKAFPCLLSFIKSLPKSKMVYVTSEDMHVFDHLASQPCFDHYKAFFTDLVERYSFTIHNIKTHTAPATVIPIISPVYGFLVKSFWETILEIIQIVDCYEYKDMLKCDSGNWKLQESIRWPESDIIDGGKQKVVTFFSSSGIKSSLFHRALEIQYKIIFQMLTHFSPENYIVKREYKYDFRVLEQDLSWWEKGLKMVKKKVGLAKRLENMTTERLVWLCLLDHTIHEVFKDDPQSQALLKPYSSLLQGQISFIKKSSAKSHETFRVMTHSILNFITSTAPYFRETREKPGIDVAILVQQMWTFSTASQEIEKDPTTFSNFRDLIAEYNRYLNLRLYINIEAAPGHFSAEISQIMQTFMRIVVTSLKKSVPTTALVGYLRSLNDFMDDFKNIDFSAMFFVKSKFFDPEVLEKVDNKLSGGNCSYRVIDIEKFVQVSQVPENQPVPRHYIIQVVSQLLESIAACLDKQWQSDDDELEATQLKSTGLLLDAIRKSFMYLKEQPDYVDFNTFEKESTDPFVHLIYDCETLNDLKKRIVVVSESFWYIRKMDEIGIDRALEMFKRANTCLESSILSDCYNLYLRHYDELVAKYRSVLSEGKSHTEGLDEVIKMLDKTRPMHFSMWTEEFKTKEIPVLLAGLSAVWSFSVSKDFSCTGKFLKPHCIQILCILRLLSVDLSEGADNHLAQVLTGQGKSVILGLLSSVLALTGHKVRVLCYSNYLSTRDQNDFNEFFQTFELHEKIQYGTFKDMANSFVNPVSNGRQSSLRQLVKDIVMNHTSWPSVTRVTPVSKNIILLVDEADVFFTDKFYGNGYFPCTCPGFLGLAKVQELIWNLAINKPSYSSVQIAQISQNHIKDEVAAGNGPMMEFSAFLNKPGTFPLLELVGVNYSVKTYTNRSLFDEHLLRMVNDALSVRDHSWARSGYVMTVDDIISYKDETGIYNQYLYAGYRNIFNYFRLKGSNYDLKNFLNYGYLNLSVGEISYARLPSQFQLILGVSGTLTNLGYYEKSGIKFYGIHNFSVLPSFFGESNLEFSKEADFHYFNTEQDWLKNVYDRANSIVELHRAVLVFFESDVIMDLFSEEYKTKFDRLNEITDNTTESRRDAYIDEAGISCTVTLATRGMGRGVDYKSSLTVEKNGGVHVIQTFFSVDMKEEVQIKGRTARKDNKGSYELMICREHLVRDKVIPADDHHAHNYSSLDAIRKQLSDEKGKTVNERIEKSERNHSTTMKYFGLI